MADSMKLELVLLGKDLLGRILAKDVAYLRQFSKSGTEAAKSAEKIDAARKKAAAAGATAANASKKEAAENKKLGTETSNAAKAEEKLNDARQRGKSSKSNLSEEIAGKNKLAGATAKAAAAEEKLNNASKRGVRRGADGRLRDARGKFVSDGKSPKSDSTNSRSSFEEDLLTGGTGAGLLLASKKGMGAAMSQQEAFADIYNSFYRASLSQKEMNGQMEKAEEISIRLGNKLKGNTSQFALMLSEMKKAGMDASTILDGAGDAAAYLAVANREDYNEVGKNYAQFGQLFQVKGKEDNLRIADLMSRANGKGISSEDLITASKYFGGRTAKTMGLMGAKGAEETLRFMTFIKQNTALDASSVGTGSSAFFRAFTKDEKKKHPVIPEAEKKYGVKLDLFDDQGKFKGLENAVAKFAQLKGKMSDKESLQFGQELAGDEGAAILSAMIEAGSTYQQANRDLDEMASMMSKAAKESDNLSNKVESLTGSLENLGAESFKPLLEPLGKATDKTNEWVGSLTEAAKKQPVFASTTASVITLGGALLTLKGGSGILSGLANRFGTVGEAAVANTSKVGRLSKSLTSLPTALKIGLTVMIAAEAWEQIQKMRSTIDDWKKMNSGLNDVGAGQYKAQQQEDEVYKERNKGTENKSWAKDGMLSVPQMPDYKGRAKDALSLLQQGNQEFTKALDPSKAGWGDWYSRGIGALTGKDTNYSLYQGRATTAEIMGNPQYAERVKQVRQMPFKQQYVDGAFTDVYERIASEVAAVKNLQHRAPMLDNPNTMTAFRQDVLPSLNLSDVKRQFVEQLLSSAFPTSFSQSSQAMEQNSSLLNQSFLNMIQPTTSVGEQMATLNTNSGLAVTGVGNLATETSNAAQRISAVEFKAPTANVVNVPIANYSSTPRSAPLFGGLFGGGRSKGGSVTKGHSYRINEAGQEFFTPNQSGSIVANDALRNRRGASASAPNISFNPTIHLYSDNPNEAMKAIKILERELARITSDIKDNFSPDRLAEKVAWSANRDSERT